MPFYHTTQSQVSRYPQSQRRPTTSAPNAEIYVSIYAPPDRRDPFHWAIYIDEQCGGRGSIHQILDECERGGYRVAPVKYDTRPDRSSLWRESIPVGALHVSSVNEARQLLQYQRVDNRSTTWNCQSWVMEALSELHRAGLTRLSREEMGRLQRLQQHWQ